MILKPKSCSFPLQRYGWCKNHFCIHVNGDVNFDKLVHENMFYSVIVGFPKSGHIWEWAGQWLMNDVICWLKDNHHVLMVPKLTGIGTWAVIGTISVCWHKHKFRPLLPCQVTQNILWVLKNWVWLDVNVVHNSTKSHPVPQIELIKWCL